jgi:hypothetical protein
MKEPKAKSILFIYVLGGMVLLLFAADSILSGSDLQKQSGYYSNLLNVLSISRLMITLTLVGFCSYFAYQTQKTFSIMYNLEAMINAEMNIPKESVPLDASLVLKEDILNHAHLVMLSKATDPKA